MPLQHIAPLAIALVVAACSGGAASTPTGAAATATAAPTAAATPGATPPASGAANRIEVALTDALRMEPATMTVPAGVPVTFVVTNEGVLEHEFYLGDEEAQAEHEAEMAAMGGMIHDEPEVIGVAPGQTKELTYTFEAPGTTLAGCHVAGHYLAGMKAVITIE